MKNLAFLLVALGLLLCSCGKDEECIPGTFEETILGTWDTPAIGDTEAGTVTFFADGTGVGSENGLFYSELNGEGSSNFDWTFNESDNVIDIAWDFDNGGLGVEMTLVSYECDLVTLNFIFNLALTRAE